MTVDPKASWKWAASVAGWREGRARQEGVQPIMDEHGRLLTDPPEIDAAWSRHYERLAADGTGHSKNRSHWRHKVEDWGLPHLSSLDATFTMEELYRATLSLKNYKAPGEDGISAEWLKHLLPPRLAKIGGLAAMEEPDWEAKWGEEDGPSLMARVILGVINRVWEGGHIPECWRVAELVSVFKKGDPLCMDNYRGISLMPVVLKVKTIMMVQRIQHAVESKNLLTREQAGFRWREECSAQAAALVEAVQRRREKRRMTFLMFVDLSKAYDIVPHEAMLAKLDQIGIRGRMLSFIRALYESSEFRVRASVPGSTTGPTIKLMRGLRQGCPLSPILFDIFINDLYGRPDMVRDEMVGVSVPAVPVRDQTGEALEEGVLSGLLFADDLVAMAKNRIQLQRQADVISEWCRTWEMRVGIKKCGVMCMGEYVGTEKTDDGVRRVMDPAAEREQRRLSLNPIRLTGQEVPVVEEYTYLGMLITRDVDMGVMATSRLAKAEKGLATIRPFLRDQSIPRTARVMVFNSVVVSSVMYGAELWGMSQMRSSRGQTLVNKGLRLILGTRETDTSIPVGALWRELGVAPIYARAAATRARAIIKYPSLKTWIGVMMRYRVGSSSTWAGGAERWLKTQYDPLVRMEESGEGNQQEEMEGASRGRKNVLRVLWAKSDKTEAESCKATRLYNECGFYQTSWSPFRAVPTWALGEQVGLGRGMRALSLCRLNAMPTGASLAKPWEGSKEAPPLAEKYLTMCVCCNVVGAGETIEHMLVECSRWERERSKYLGMLMDSMIARHVPLSGQCILLLGGEYMGHRLTDWLPPRRRPVKQPGDCHGHRDVIICGAYQVARFLQGIERSRTLILRQARKENVPSLQNLGPNSHS